MILIRILEHPGIWVDHPDCPSDDLGYRLWAAPLTDGGAPMACQPECAADHAAHVPAWFTLARPPLTLLDTGLPGDRDDPDDEEAAP